MNLTCERFRGNLLLFCGDGGRERLRREKRRKRKHDGTNGREETTERTCWESRKG